MKKIIISIIVILIIVVAFLIIVKDFTVFGWDNKNIDDIKKMNEDLDEEIEIAKEAKEQKYPDAVEKLERAIEDLKKAKERYENKLKYLSEDVELGIVHIKEYKIDRLWVVLGNYAKDESVNLKLDILGTNGDNTYDLDITIIGSYINITDFIYDIEKDDTLGFKIVNFKLVPASASEVTVIDDSDDESGTTTRTTATDVTNLKATFRVESVGIEFD